MRRYGTIAILVAVLLGGMLDTSWAARGRRAAAATWRQSQTATYVGPERKPQRNTVKTRSWRGVRQRVKVDVQLLSTSDRKQLLRQAMMLVETLKLPPHVRKQARAQIYAAAGNPSIPVNYQEAAIILNSGEAESLFISKDAVIVDSRLGAGTRRTTFDVAAQTEEQRELKPLNVPSLDRLDAMFVE